LLNWKHNTMDSKEAFKNLIKAKCLAKNVSISNDDLLVHRKNVMNKSPEWIREAYRLRAKILHDQLFAENLLEQRRNNLNKLKSLLLSD
jgi:hypothetical protein